MLIIRYTQKLKIPELLPMPLQFDNCYDIFIILGDEASEALAPLDRVALGAQVAKDFDADFLSFERTLLRLLDLFSPPPTVWQPLTYTEGG